MTNHHTQHKKEPNLFQLHASLEFPPSSADKFSNGDWNSDAGSSSSSRSSDYTPVALGGLYFQLEELEDCESSTTELLLNDDNTVTVGETDGPIYLEASGTWTTQQASSSSTMQEFAMTVTRRYEAGKEATELTDVGTFEFNVERTFIGEITNIGANVGVTGKIHMYDDILGDEEVGYFNMIDTTKERDMDGQQNELMYEPKKKSSGHKIVDSSPSVPPSTSPGSSFDTTGIKNTNIVNPLAGYSPAPPVAPALIDDANDDNINEVQQQSQEFTDAGINNVYDVHQNPQHLQQLEELENQYQEFLDYISYGVDGESVDISGQQKLEDIQDDLRDENDDDHDKPPPGKTRISFSTDTLNISID